MRLFVLTLVLLSIIGLGCNKCGRIDCSPCPPETANYQFLVAFDTSNAGFKEDELDTIYIYKFDKNMVLIDSNHWSLNKRNTNDRKWNLLEGRAFDDLHDRDFTAHYYQLQVKNNPKKYMLRDFEITFVPRNPKSCCECDKSYIERVNINDTVINKLRFPYMIRK